MATMAIGAGMISGRQTMSATGARRSAGLRAESIVDRNRRLFEEQRKARRGPALEVFFTKHIDNSRVRKENDPIREREMRSFTLAMSVLFLLVMVYVWQHFTAIEVGYHVESQKVQVEQLREANRELRLTEAQLTDPNRIERMARQMGLNVAEPGQRVHPDGADTLAPALAQAQLPALR